MYIPAASTLPENLIATLLHANGASYLRTIPDLHTNAMAYLTEMPQTEWPDELLVLHDEMHTVRALLASDEPEVHVDGLSAAMSTEDVGYTEEIPQGTAAAIETFGDSEIPMEDAALAAAKESEAPPATNIPLLDVYLHFGVGRGVRCPALPMPRTRLVARDRSAILSP